MLKNPEFTHPSRLLKTVAWTARAALWLVLAVWSLFALSWGVLHYLIVPRVDQWRPALEAVATRALGVSVTVGQVQANAGTTMPTLELHDVRLYDRQGREALHLPRVHAAVSARSLWRLGVEQLVIEAPRVQVRRNAQGDIEVGGMVLGQGRDDDGRLADWLFSQPELAVRRGELYWLDDTRPQAGAWRLSAIDWVSRNEGRQHQWQIDATPEAQWGERFSLRGQFSSPLWPSRPGDWRRWSGTFYADLPRVDVRQLQQHWDLPPAWGLGLEQGRGALRVWADWQRGDVRAVQADLALPEVMLRWRDNPLALHLHDLTVRLHAQRQGDRTQFSTQGLRFRTGLGQVWAPGDVRFGYTGPLAGPWSSWEWQADRLDLAQLQQMALPLPLPTHWRDTLAQAQPQGVFQALVVRWQAAEAGRSERWSASGRASGLSIEPGATPPPQGREPVFGRPGGQGVSVEFDVHQAGGRATLQLNQGALVFPGVFVDPRLPIDRLQADVRWSVQGEHIELDVPKLSFANADAQGQGRLRWHTGDPATSRSGGRFPGVLDLDLTLDRANGAQVHRYLPRTLPEDTLRYLREAVRRGEVRDARFRVQGDLWTFPYADPTHGTFEVRAQLHHVDLNYVPAHLLAPNEPRWPALAPVQAQLHIDRVRLHILGASGAVQGLPQLQVAQADAVIDNFMSKDPLLQVRATVQGPGEQALAFVNGSPLRTLLEQALDEAQVRGPLEVGLTLALPLNRTRDATISGQVQFKGNDWRLSADAPWLLATHGLLEFNERGFRVPQARATLLGGELRFHGGMTRRPDGSAQVQFQGQGSVTADGLRRADALGPGWGALARLGHQAQGATRYQVQLSMGAAGRHLLITSNLQGLELALPAPLHKPLAAALPLRVDLLTQARAAGRPDTVRDRLDIELGQGTTPLLHARYEREHSAQGTRVLRGTLSVQSERLAWPERGVAARLSLGDVDAQAWEQWLEQSGGPSDGNAPATADRSTADAAQAYWPSELGLTARRLSHGGRAFHDVVAGGTREGDRWRLSLSARELNGYVEFRPATGHGAGRIYARLARLSLPPASARRVEQLLQAPPRFAPSLDVVVEDLELNHRRLGRLEVVAVNRQAQQGQREALREWRLTTLNLTVPEARLQATGNWVAPRRTALSVQLDIEDSGALLARFGMPDVVRGGRGSLQGTLGWMGSPLALDLPSLAGELQLDLQRGQFLQADPGLAKLLGVLSLQSLPRRLVLDFRDVFSQGFAFDFVRGHARIEQGVISTNNLQMKGVNAAVLIEGSADIQRETQDITAVVIPELNAGTASLLATAINPVTGLGTLLAQFVLRQPLQEAATQQFRITGPWADPVVERVNRRNIAPTPGAQAPPGASP